MTNGISIEADKLKEATKAAGLWFNIRYAAKTDPVLQELLDQFILYYRLKYESEKSK
jgi:hypothetical protein